MFGINDITALVISNYIISESPILSEGRWYLDKDVTKKLKLKSVKLTITTSPLPGFVTGFERVPILGMEKIEMKVGVVKVQDLSYDEYYPQTHTCFSTLELPVYSTKEIMQTKLIEALSNSKHIYK